MTPAQLRAFSTVVRLGTVKDAARELGVSEAAVSAHVAQLRKELGDRLFTRSKAGLAFTPGGLRLATRANEMLGLQDQTVREVSEAGRGRRVLRLAVSSLFGEYAAPGLIGLFSTRADDLDVEMSVRPPGHFEAMLVGRSADMAIGPTMRALDEAISHKPFLKYQVVAVAGPTHPLAGQRVSAAQLLKQIWLLGPEAAGGPGVVTAMVEAHRVPEANQRIFQSHAAALEETRRGRGIGLAVEFSVAQDLAAGRLVPRRRAPNPERGNVERDDPERNRSGVGRRRARPLHHDAAGDPGHAQRFGRQHRPLPTVGAHHPLAVTESVSRSSSCRTRRFVGCRRRR